MGNGRPECAIFLVALEKPIPAFAQVLVGTRPGEHLQCPHAPGCAAQRAAITAQAMRAPALPVGWVL